MRDAIKRGRVDFADDSRNSFNRGGEGHRERIVAGGIRKNGKSDFGAGFRKAVQRRSAEAQKRRKRERREQNPEAGRQTSEI
jgi:hypothetical protein